MRSSRRKLVLALAFAALAPAGMWVLLSAARMVPAPGEPLFALSDRLSSLRVVGEGDAVGVSFGGTSDGGGTTLDAGTFLEEVRRRQEQNHGWRRLFLALDITSVTSILWVVFGLLGQALFMGRMLVQWLASEQARASVVPTSFWWLSLVGSSMLMVYFVWRVEIVGFIGQSTGWLIYLRNLWLIYTRPRTGAPGAAGR